jgi:hypothetical protein
VQLTLAILEVPSLPAMPRDRLDADARAKAIEILARIIAQALVAPDEAYGKAPT